MNLPSNVDSVAILHERLNNHVAWVNDSRSVPFPEWHSVDWSV